VNKLVLFIIIFLPFSKAIAYEIGFVDYGVNYQVLQVDDNTKDEMQVGSVAHALGLYFTYTPYKYSRSIYKNWHSTLGADLVYISDESPFSQSVTGGSGNGVSTKESKVMGYSAYLETGLSFYIKGLNSSKAGLIIGYKYNNIDRTIFKCSDCNKQDLHSFSHSVYLKPFFSFSFLHNIDGQLYLTHYFGNSGFKHGLGLQITF